MSTARRLSDLSRCAPWPDEAWERYWSRVDKSGICWLWTGGVMRRKGKPQYGRITVRSDLFYVHRVSFELHHGPIPAGLVPDHACYQQLCIHPEHIAELVTKAENTRRWWEHWRELNGRTPKLSHPEQRIDA